MDEKRLADQPKKTGNLTYMTFVQDWQTATVEDDGWVKADVMAQPYYNYLKSLTHEQRRFLRLPQLLAFYYQS